MTDEQFEYLIEEALTLIPKDFKDLIDNVSILFADFPSRDQLVKTGTKGLLLGLYEGVPKTKGGGYSKRYPDKITLFKYPLMRISKDLEDLKRNVYNTLIHEIGHHFGMDEKAVREAEKDRRAR